MKTPGGRKMAPVFIKLKANVLSSSTSNTSSGSSIGDVPVFVSLEARYKRLMDELDQRAAGSNDNLQSSQQMVTPLAKISRSKSDNALHHSESKRDLVDAFPVALKRKPSNLLSANSYDSSFRRSLIHQGDPVVVLDVLKGVGSWCVFGSDLMTVALADDDSGSDSRDVNASTFYAAVKELSYQSNLYATATSGYGASSCASGDAEIAQATLQWTLKEGGKIVEVMIESGKICRDGDVLFVLDCSPAQQQFAHLCAADDIATGSHHSAWLQSMSTQQSISTSLNERYQMLTEQLIEHISRKTRDPFPLLQCCEEIERVSRDFMETARMYGRLIISEMHLPLERKTIRPLKMGGVLGGAKFVVRGVLFKIPQADMFNNYPDPIYVANKVQGHELKGLKAYFGWFFNRGSVGLVSFPLMAIIDYKGHRIIAMTQLPIKGRETLIYGSDNAGGNCDVVNSVPEWSSFIFEASVGLNLKPHFTVNGRHSGNEIEIASCVDLEGHKGVDRRFYLLDFSRTFPCAYKDPKFRSSHDTLWPFYHMMRPEFVKQWNRPLSADAYSSFQSVVNTSRENEAKASNQEIRSATETIECVVVMCVCKSLFSSFDGSLSLRHVFHREGLNMRYLGLVYRKLVSDFNEPAKQVVHKLIQVESLVRVFKKEMRAILRSSLKRAKGEDSESLMLVACADALNCWFFHPSSFASWKKENSFLCECLISCFTFTSDHADGLVNLFLDARFFSDEHQVTEPSSAGLRELVSFKFSVLRRLNDVLGLGIKAKVLDELKYDSAKTGHRRGMSRKFRFSYSDLQFEERVKHVDVVERANGLSELLKSESAEKSVAADHLLKGFDILENALEASPNDPWLSLLMGDICARMHAVLRNANKKRTAVANAANAPDATLIKSLVEDLRIIQLFYDRTLLFYNQAAKFDNNPESFVKLALFLSASENMEEKFQEVEDLYLKALEICCSQKIALDERALIGLVALQEKKGNKTFAIELRERSKNFITAHNNWHGAKAKKTDVEPSPASVSASPALRDRKLTLGKNRAVKLDVTARTSSSAIEDSKLSPRARGPILRAMTKVGNVVAKRRSPRLHVPSSDSSRNSGSVSEGDSARSSKIEDDEEDLEFESSMQAAMERNQKLREVLSLSEINQKGESSDEDETVAEDLHDFFRSAAGNRISTFGK
jgi:tetratricopeptide (TPR) repeat protein